MVCRLKESFLSEPELAANAITSEHIHLGSDLGHAVAHPGTDQWHVPQGIRAYSLK